MAGGTGSDAEGKRVPLGAPLDCSASGRGEARAPGALRAANLAQTVGVEDLGNLDAAIDDPSRPEAGVIGYGQIREASSRTRARNDATNRNDVTTGSTRTAPAEPPKPGPQKRRE